MVIDFVALPLGVFLAWVDRWFALLKLNYWAVKSFQPLFELDGVVKIFQPLFKIDWLGSEDFSAIVWAWWGSEDFSTFVQIDYLGSEDFSAIVWTWWGSEVFQPLFKLIDWVVKIFQPFVWTWLGVKIFQPLFKMFCWAGIFSSHCWIELYIDKHSTIGYWGLLSTWIPKDFANCLFKLSIIVKVWMQFANWFIRSTYCKAWMQLSKAFWLIG